MPHVALPEGAPGILGPLSAYPETARPLNEFTQVLLRGPSSLSPAERELIAAYVSTRNECTFCANSHAAAARHLFGLEQQELVDLVRADLDTAPVSSKLKALLRIAGKVQRSGRDVSEDDIRRAREEGADDRAIHDTVLVAAAFCMFNRYVDGLATLTPDDASVYDRIGADLAARGYASAR